MSLGFSAISNIFFYDLWEDVTFLFTNQTFRENNGGVSVLHALPNDAHIKLNNTLSKIEKILVNKNIDTSILYNTTTFVPAEQYTDS